MNKQISMEVITQGKRMSWRVTHVILNSEYEDISIFDKEYLDQMLALAKDECQSVIYPCNPAFDMGNLGGLIAVADEMSFTEAEAVVTKGISFNTMGSLPKLRIIVGTPFGNVILMPYIGKSGDEDSNEMIIN